MASGRSRRSLERADRPLLILASLSLPSSGLEDIRVGLKGENFRGVGDCRGLKLSPDESSVIFDTIRRLAVADFTAIISER